MLVAAGRSNAAPPGLTLDLYGEARGQNPEAELWVLASDHSFAAHRPMLRKLVAELLAREL